jgi:hypothetical protein
MTTTPSHELLWLHCAAKRCCVERTVRPTGGDIWRIATALQLRPERFLRAIPADPPDDGFLLASHRAPQHLALARRPAKWRQGACAFLMLLGDDVARCGLGALRPLPCQAFPASAGSGAPHLAEAGACTCRSWTLADLDRPAVAALLAREAEERALDRQIVAQWNQSAAGAEATLAEAAAYMLRAYERRAAGGAP